MNTPKPTPNAAKPRARPPGKPCAASERYIAREVYKLLTNPPGRPQRRRPAPAAHHPRPHPHRPSPPPSTPPPPASPNSNEASNTTETSPNATNTTSHDTQKFLKTQVVNNRSIKKSEKTPAPPVLTSSPAALICACWTPSSKWNKSW